MLQIHFTATIVFKSLAVVSGAIKSRLDSGGRASTAVYLSWTFQHCEQSHFTCRPNLEVSLMPQEKRRQTGSYNYLARKPVVQMQINNPGAPLHSSLQRLPGKSVGSQMSSAGNSTCAACFKEGICCRFVDASSFQKCDDQDSEYAKDPIAYIGAELARHGYARHGQEVMINGFTGEEMPCDIFVGLVYYQRLRHMVKDKFQVCCAQGCPALNVATVVSSHTRHVLFSLCAPRLS